MAWNRNIRGKNRFVREIRGLDPYVFDALIKNLGLKNGFRILESSVSGICCICLETSWLQVKKGKPHPRGGSRKLSSDVREKKKITCRFTFKFIRMIQKLFEFFFILDAWKETLKSICILTFILKCTKVKCRFGLVSFFLW